MRSHAGITVVPSLALSLLVAACGSAPLDAIDDEESASAAIPSISGEIKGGIPRGRRRDLAMPPPQDLASPPPDMASSPDLTSPPPPPPPPPSGSAHRRCGWIGPGDAAGASAFAANAAFYDVIHPDWYALASDGVGIRTLYGAENPTVLQAAAAHGVALWPMVVAVDDVNWIRAMINDPTKRAAHIRNLVDLAVSKNYAGLDIDYEHLWSAADYVPFTTFMTELAAAMHAAGKKVSDDAPGMTFAYTGAGWNYPVLARELDAVHIMAYDYHSLGTHEGPVAPLGWVQTVIAYAASTGLPQKFVLGLPNYGVTPTWFCAAADCIATCGGSYATTTSHMSSCSYNDRGYVAGRAPNCATGSGRLHFDDAASMEEKVSSAKAKGLAGITYWTVGSEPPGFFDMVRRYY